MHCKNVQPGSDDMNEQFRGHHLALSVALTVSVGDPNPEPYPICMFLGLSDPDPLVRGTDPDPSLFSYMC